MNRLAVLLLVLIILSIGAFILVRNNAAEKKGLLRADRGFTVDEFDEVDKIVIKHTKLQPLVFTRSGKSWLVNGKYDVDPYVFINIEKVLTHMQMLYIPSEAATTTVMQSIKNNGIQVDVFKGGNKPERIIFIGTDTQKGDGTFMILGGESQPYVMHLPGLAGGLRSRFEQPLENFRDLNLFKLAKDQIEYVQVEYPKQNTSSFRIENAKGVLKIQPLVPAVVQPTTMVNQRAIDLYLSGFEHLGAEKLMNDYPLKDSVLLMMPNCVLEIKTTDNELIRHQYYAYDDFQARSGNARSPEEVRKQNRLFVLVNKTDFYTVQNRVSGKLFLGYENFMVKSGKFAK